MTTPDTEIVEAEFADDAGPFGTPSPAANGDAVAPTPSRELALRPVWRDAPAVSDVVDGWVAHANQIWTLAEKIQDTAFVPKDLRGNAPAIACCILTGRELAIGPMMSLRYVQIVRGYPTLAAEYKRARVLAAGHGFRIVERTTSRCILMMRRRGVAEWTEFKFSLDDARAAGLVKSDSAWVTRPRRMLFARASSEGCDALFADVTLGLPTTELVEAGTDADPFAGYAEVADAGSVPAEPKRKAQRATPARPGRAAGEPDLTEPPAGGGGGGEPAPEPAVPKPDPDTTLIGPEHPLHKRLFALFREVGISGQQRQQRDLRLRVAGALSERGTINSLDDLTVTDALKVAAALDGAIAFGKTQSEDENEQRQAAFRAVGEVVTEQEKTAAAAQAEPAPSKAKAKGEQQGGQRRARPRNEPPPMADDDPGPAEPPLDGE